MNENAESGENPGKVVVGGQEFFGEFDLSVASTNSNREAADICFEALERTLREWEESGKAARADAEAVGLPLSSVFHPDFGAPQPCCPDDSSSVNCFVGFYEATVTRPKFAWNIADIVAPTKTESIIRLRQSLIRRMADKAIFEKIIDRETCEIIYEEAYMPVVVLNPYPNYVSGPVAEGKKGAAEKPAK